MEFVRREWYTMNEKVGPVAQKMVVLEDWLKTQQTYNEQDEVTREIIIIDALLTATNENRDSYFWIGMPTCAEQLLAVIKSQLELGHDWDEAPLLPPVATTISTVCVLNAKAQKLDNMYMNNGKVQIELAKNVVGKYDDEKRRARNSTSLG